MELLNNYIRVEVLPDKKRKLILKKPSQYAKVRVLQIAEEYRNTPGESPVQVGDVLAVTRANVIELEGSRFVTEDDIYLVLDNENMEVA